jgi:hypothetical protein
MSVSRLRILLPEVAHLVEIATLPGDGCPADAARPSHYIVVVARGETALYDYLDHGFCRDAKVEVVLDRRRGDRRHDARSPAQERRRSDRRRRQVEDPLTFNRVLVVRRYADSPPSVHVPSAATRNPEGKERRLMGEMEPLDDRHRVNRWLEESQYLIGRLIPGFLDDRDRLRLKLEQAEQDAERLRHEVSELRKEVNDLQSERQFFQTEQTAMAEAFGSVMDHLGQMHKPLNEVLRRLQPAPPVTFDNPE